MSILFLLCEPFVTNLGTHLMTTDPDSRLNIRNHLKSHGPIDYIGDNVLLSIDQSGGAEPHTNTHALQVQFVAEMATTATTQCYDHDGYTQ